MFCLRFQLCLESRRTVHFFLAISAVMMPSAASANTTPQITVPVSPAGETGTVIWGVVFALAALGIITAEIARKKCTVRRDSKQS